MAGCSDERFEKMLYAYELGMLSAEEREAVEMHLLECEHCFERRSRGDTAETAEGDDPAVQCRQACERKPQREGFDTAHQAR